MPESMKQQDSVQEHNKHHATGPSWKPVAPFLVTATVGTLICALCYFVTDPSSLQATRDNIRSATTNDVSSRRELKPSSTKYAHTLSTNKNGALPPKNPKPKSTGFLPSNVPKDPNATRTLRSWRALLSNEESNILRHDEAVVIDEMFGTDENLMQGESPCNAIGKFGDSLEMRRKCVSYLSLPYIMPNCTMEEQKVPKIYHSVGHESSQSYHQLATSAANPDFVRNHVGDLEALEYVREKCGQEAAETYECLAAPAYRGDLFRFCAMYAEGGVYLDEDIFPHAPLEELYSPCASATVGHDFPFAGKPGKQMKILAGAPGAPIFKCAMDSVINHVRNREYPGGNPLAISGPTMLHKCYEKHSEDVAITYHDTRDAQYPYSGMRRGNKILAYEIPGIQRHKLLNDPNHYDLLFQQKKIYRDTCPLQPNTDFPSVDERVRYYMGSWYDKKAVDSEDLCKSIDYYHDGDQVSLSSRPFLFNQDALENDEVAFNSARKYLVPRLGGNTEGDSLLLHFTQNTPALVYEYPVFVRSRVNDAVNDGFINPKNRLPLIAPLQVNVDFALLNRVEDNDMPWGMKKDSIALHEAVLYNQTSENVVENLLKEQLGKKYILSVESDDVDPDLSWKLYSNSVVFMRTPMVVSWLMEDKLVPYYHYIPLEDDMSDLEKKILWAIHHDDKSKLIAMQGKKYIEDLWMSEKAKAENEEIMDTMIRRYDSHYGSSLSSCQTSETTKSAT